MNIKWLTTISRALEIKQFMYNYKNTKQHNLLKDKSQFSSLIKIAFQ